MVYFVYLPAARAEDQIDIINKQGNEIINTVNNQIDTISDDTRATLISICQTINDNICFYNAGDNGCGGYFIGGCRPSVSISCPLTIEAYPVYCRDLVPIDPACLCTTCTI